MTKPCVRSLARRLAAGSLVALAALATLAALDRGNAGYLPVEGARRMLLNGGLPPVPHSRLGFAARPVAQAAIDDYVARRRLAALEADIIAVAVIARALEQQQALDTAAFEAAALAELALKAPALALPSSPPEIQTAPAAVASAPMDSAVTEPVETAITAPDPVPDPIPAPIPGQVPAVAAAHITATDAAALPPVARAADVAPKPSSSPRVVDDEPPPRPAARAARKPVAKATASSESGWTRGIHDQSRN